MTEDFKKQTFTFRFYLWFRFMYGNMQVKDIFCSTFSPDVICIAFTSLTLKPGWTRRECNGVCVYVCRYKQQQQRLCQPSDTQPLQQPPVSGGLQAWPCRSVLLCSNIQPSQWGGGGGGAERKRNEEMNRTKRGERNVCAIEWFCSVSLSTSLVTCASLGIN